MKTLRLKPALLSLAFSVTLIAAIPALRAGPIYHAPAGFSVTVHDSSTLFNNNVTFNGSRTSLVGPAQVQNVGAGSDILSGFVTATFMADPGYVFTNALLSIGTWTFGNGAGAYGHYGSWSIPGSTYAGDINPPEDPFDLTAWSGSGSSGSFSRSNFQPWSGGGSDFQSIMGPFGTYPILLDYVSSFTVTMDMTLWVHTTSAYTISALNVHTVMTEAPPVTAVPDGPIPFALFGAVLFGTMLLGTRVQAHRGQSAI